MSVINQMVFSSPRPDSIKIIALQKVEKLLGMNQMSLSEPWSESLDIIYFQPVKKTRD